MDVTLDDPDDASAVGAKITGGTPTAGSLLIVEAPNGTDRRVYRVISVDGSTLKVRREPLSTAVFL